MTRHALALCLVVLTVGCESAKSEPPPGSPGSPDLCMWTLEGTTAVDRMIADLQDAVRKHPRKLDDVILLGRAWVRKAREAGDPDYYANAEKCAEKALAITPDSPLALSLQALVLTNDHRFGEARELANRTLAKDPENLLALSVLSDAELELGHYDAAVAAAQAFVDLKPSLPSYSRASYLRWLVGDTKAAKQMVRLAIRSGADGRDPEPTAWTLVQAAMYFFAEGDYDGADAGFDTALKQLPGFAPALVGKGRVALAKGDAKSAVDYLAKAYAASPLAETAWLLGDARALSGDPAGAESAYADVLAAKRSDKLTVANFLATKNRNPTEALSLIESELQTRGGPYVDDVHAWALYRNHRLPEALAASNRALSLGTLDARLLYHAGAIRLALGDPTGRTLIERALTLNPHFDPTATPEAAALLGRS